MSQAVPAGSLIFQDGPTDRDFVAVSAQGSAMQDFHYEFRTSSSQYGNGLQSQTLITGKTAKTAPMVLNAQMEWTGRQLGTVKMLITRPPVEQPMASLCLPGSGPGSRCFLLDRTGSGMKSQYTWSRTGASYILTGPASEVLARYERAQTSPQNPPHAMARWTQLALVRTMREWSNPLLL